MSTISHKLNNSYHKINTYFTYICNALHSSELCFQTNVVNLKYGMFSSHMRMFEIFRWVDSFARTESNKILCFTCSLCVSDLLFCLTVLPFAVSRFVHGDWVHNEFLCSMVPMLRYGNVGVSLLSIAMISVNRYLLIAWPQLYPKVYTKCKVAIFVILCWAISYVLMIPTLLGVWGTFGYDEKLRTCSINEDEHGRSSKSTFFSVGFALPCIIIVVCYTRIYWVVRK